MWRDQVCSVGVFSCFQSVVCVCVWIRRGVGCGKPVVTLVFRLTCFFTVLHKQNSALLYCAHMFPSLSRLSQPDCQDTSGPNKVCVCVCVFTIQPSSLAFCTQALLSLLQPWSQKLYFNRVYNCVCAPLGVVVINSYLIFCLLAFQGLIIFENSADFPALMLIAGMVRRNSCPWEKD